MLHAAQILDRCPVPREAYGKHSEAAVIQIRTHKAQLGGQSRKAMNEKGAMTPSRQQKGFGAFKVHDNSSDPFVPHLKKSLHR